MKLEITLTEVEAKAIAYVAEDPVFWANNLIKNHCRITIEKIVEEEVQRMLQDPTVTNIPADKDAIILAADLEPASVRFNKIKPPFVEGTDGV